MSLFLGIIIGLFIATPAEPHVEYCTKYEYSNPKEWWATTTISHVPCETLFKDNNNEK